MRVVRQKEMKILPHCIALLLLAGCSSPRILTSPEMQQHLHSRGIDGFVYDCATPATANLKVESSTVESLSFVHNINLTSLDISTTCITDVSPLAGHSLLSIRFDPQLITNGLRAVRQMTTLTQINDLSPQDFWTQYDAGKFNPPREQLARWPKGYKGDPILRLSPEARKMKLEVEQPDAEVQPEGAPSD